MRTAHRRTGMLVAAGLLAAALHVSGCTALRLPGGVQVAPDDWPMNGRTASRTALAAGWVVPPLVPDWEADLGSGVGTGSPLAADSFIVVGTLRGEVLAFHARTGKKLGGASFGDAVPGSPALRGNVVYVPLANSSESIVAYDLAQGKILWKQTCGDIATSPLLLEQRLYAGTADGALLCIGTETGSILWRYELPANTTLKGIRSSPASDGSLIVFGADDGHVYALDALLGTLRWRCPAGAPVMAGVALESGSAFVATVEGAILAIDLASGHVRWTYRAGSPVYAGAALADGMVVVGTTGGVVYALRQEDGRKVWECALRGAISAPGVISGSWFFVGTLSRLITALRLTDGSVAWRDSLEGRVKTSPAVARDRLVIATDDRVLHAYRGGTR
jgi:outer membrane protein assembly factor BamB